MNPLSNYPEVRKYLYLAQFIIAGVILLISVGFAAAGMDFPTWYVVTSAVASAAWSYLGLTAATNTPAARPQDQRGQANVVSILAIVVLVLAALWLVGVLPAR